MQLREALPVHRVGIAEAGEMMAALEPGQQRLGAGEKPDRPGGKIPHESRRVKPDAPFVDEPGREFLSTDLAALEPPYDRRNQPAAPHFGCLERGRQQRLECRTAVV